MKVVDEAAFRRRSAGAMVLGSHWIYGSPDGKLYFSLAHGAVDDVSALLRLWESELSTKGHVSLCDATALTVLTPDAFGAVGAFLERHREALARSVRRQAIVRPSGMPGTVVAGYYLVFPPSYPYQVFDHRSAALAWLGYPDDALAAADTHAGDDPLLRQLRALLIKRPSAPPLGQVATELAVSARSLQRRLGHAGTSFAREVTRARIERSMHLLLTTDKKLAAVASEVGCASLATFSEMFAREVGEPPSQWRAARRNREA